MTMTAPPEYNNRFRAMLNTIFVISWNAVLLMEKTRVPHKKKKQKQKQTKKTHKKTVAYMIILKQWPGCLVCFYLFDAVLGMLLLLPV